MDENQRSAVRLIRVLDANFNRAREAARVLEDAARFLLDDALLTQAAKDLRHRLWSEVRSLPVAGDLSLGRDTPADVGTAMTAAAEQERAGSTDVVDAAFGRFSEAIRALEEYSKLLDPAVAGRLKQIRYDGYTLHTRLMRRLRPKVGVSRLRLCVLITAALCRGDWMAVAEAALAGGADCLQLREKSLQDAELLKRARAVAGLCRRYDALFIVNDRADIAVLAGADGVHVGQDDLPIGPVRRIVGPDLIVGKSTRTLEEAVAAATGGPDYIGVGPIFPSLTKPQEHVAGLETLRQVAAQVKIPLVAIGGITPENASDVLAAGACGIAVCQAVIAQPDVKAAAARLKAVLQ
jgi:thiamine-phosphate pyrophosphorylase